MDGFITLLYILSIAFIFLLVSLFIPTLIFYAIIYAIKRRFKLKHPFLSDRNLKILALSVPILFYSYHFYYAIYPPNDFYFQEFEKVTELDVPKSAEIVYKDASYPDFTGDYHSESIMKLSKEDYFSLLEKMKKNLHFKEIKAVENAHHTFMKEENTDFIFVSFLKKDYSIKTTAYFN